MLIIIWLIFAVAATLIFFRKRIVPTILGIILTFSITIGLSWLSILFLRANTILAGLIGLAVALLFVRLLLVPSYSQE